MKFLPPLARDLKKHVFVPELIGIHVLPSVDWNEQQCVIKTMELSMRFYFYMLLWGFGLKDCYCVLHDDFLSLL